MQENLKKDLRKYYFKGELKKFLNKLQEDEPISEEMAKEIELELLKLKEEDLNIEKKFNSGGNIPSSYELMEGVEWSDEDEQKVETVIKSIQDKIHKLRTIIINKGKIEENQFLNTSLDFLACEPILNKYFIYKKQKYFQKIIDIIDSSGCSRLEAENRAKITKEYSEYKRLQKIVGEQNITGLIQEFINLAKKYENKTY